MEKCEEKNTKKKKTKGLFGNYFQEQFYVLHNKSSKKHVW